MLNYLKKLGFSETGLERKLHSNLPRPQLIEDCLGQGIGKLASNGALVIETGRHTGRAAQDKYVVRTSLTEDSIWWENQVREMSTATYQKLREDVVGYLSSQNSLYFTDRSVGASAEYNVGVRLLSCSPSHALFSNYVFREKMHAFGEDDFTILHAPNLNAKNDVLGTRSSTVIVTNFDEKEIIIVGTKYAGEIKKSMFSIMNFILPEKGVLPTHSGANCGQRGDVSIFFGLSGTGKTTLSTDEGRLLIGDDEHGLSDKGVFNFEGGCYAKTYRLSDHTEPGIYKASTEFGALLENVILKEDRTIDFFDKSLTENGRSSYPLTAIDSIEKSAMGGIPNHLFFLTADAFGVLPPIAKLTPDQAMYYFILGYTAKLAGTEMGITEPKATFSACFGAPFMMRRPEVYARLLGDYMDKHPVSVWLINTGWTGGAYGEGSRFPLKVTRELIRAVQSTDLEGVSYNQDEVFGLHIPKKVQGVDNQYLNPKESWKDQGEYDKKANELAREFKKHMAQFDSSEQFLNSGGPLI